MSPICWDSLSVSFDKQPSWPCSWRIQLLTLSPRQPWLHMSCRWKNVVAMEKAPVTKCWCNLKCWTCAANASWHCVWQAPCLAVIYGNWFWTKFHPNHAFSWWCPTILQGLLWMKLSTNKALAVNGQTSRLPMCPSICFLPGFSPKDRPLQMKSFRWLELQKWQGWVTKRLPCYKICQTAFAIWVLTRISIRAWTMWPCQQAFKV